ncbi:unnamed protein product [Rotaria sp. Silwood2]|nr:unnamed protein product [Rotaria sp. Silwood2]CAF3424586.1 unnamed protein product [Rotaria sp. Silwood2]CAF4268109.1 unnamed protein product [Rotaria sp. Silwood2]CAF4399781.1 unnamed protein product [Rotaria sp. Silwood2]
MHFLKLQIQYGGDVYEMILPTNSSDPIVEELQQHIEKQFNIPTHVQRIMFKGQNLHEQPTGALRRYGITNASLIRLVGRKQPIRR